MNSKAPKLLKINAVLFLLATAVSGYLVWLHYQITNGVGVTSFCQINSTIDCISVIGSRYSELAGVPLATIGLTYFILGLILSLVGASNSFSRREALVTLAPLTIISVLASLGTLSITLFLLHKWCIMCISMQLLSLATCVVTWLALCDFTSGSCSAAFGQANRKKIGTYLGAGLAIFVVTFGLTSQLRNEVFPLADPEKFVNDFRAEKVQAIDPGSSPRQGFQGDNPPLRLIEFADFQCPACGFAAHQMHRLVQIYGDKIQLIFKNFPLDPTCNPAIKHPIHPFACLAAKTAYCANKQGKFQQLYDKMFDNQKDISPDNIAAWVTEVGMDLKLSDECVADPATTAALQPDMVLAEKLGLESTPTFFVGGRMVKGAIDEARLKLLMRELGI